MSITSFMGGMTFVYMQVAFYGTMGARGLRNTARHPEIFAGLNDNRFRRRLPFEPSS